MYRNICIYICRNIFKDKYKMGKIRKIMILTSYIHAITAGVFFMRTCVYLCCEVKLYP
jgi:hypothetical protein